MTHHTDDQDLMDAVLNCPHSITHDAITLHFSPKQKEGHNALAQLRHRLAAYDAAAKAREMELLAVIEDLERLIPLINQDLERLIPLINQDLERLIPLTNQGETKA